MAAVADPAPATLHEYRAMFTDPDRLARTMIELGGEVIGDLMVKIEDAWAQAEVVEGAARLAGSVWRCQTRMAHPFDGCAHPPWVRASTPGAGIDGGDNG